MEGDERQASHDRVAAEGSAPMVTPRVIADEPTGGDRAFDAVTAGAGLLVLVLLTLVGIFLFLRAGEAFDTAGWGFLTSEEWRTDVDPPEIGVLGLVSGTVLVALVAVAIAVPLGTCAALFISDYATGKWRSLLTGLVDLLAAIPSLLYGLWGFLLLAGQLTPLLEWLGRHAGLVPALPGRARTPITPGRCWWPAWSCR